MPGKLVDAQPKWRINVVFDIDHTLIFAMDKRLHPNLKDKNWEIHEMTLKGGHQMWLIVRYGVK